MLAHDTGKKLVKCLGGDHWQRTLLCRFVSESLIPPNLFTFEGFCHNIRAHLYFVYFKVLSLLSFYFLILIFVFYDYII